MVARGLDDERELLSWSTPAKEEGHDESMRESDLGAVHGSITCGLWERPSILSELSWHSSTKALQHVP